MSQKKKTHFGYQSIDWDKKTEKVGRLFHSVAANYDLMNDLMSFGLHRLWKRFTLAVSHVQPGQSILDLAGGTGDLTALFSKRVGPEGHVYLADINASMLTIGRDRLLNKSLHNISCVQANAESLPFPNASFHCITIAFGLRNITNKQAALKAMYRVCKPGGKVMILEFSAPTLPGLKPLYDWYSFNVIPKLGQLISNDADSYNYLAESIRVHPTQEPLKDMIEAVGFEDCHYHNLSGGIVALHVASKY